MMHSLMTILVTFSFLLTSNSVHSAEKRLNLDLDERNAVIGKRTKSERNIISAISNESRCGIIQFQLFCFVKWKKKTINILAVYR